MAIQGVVEGQYNLPAYKEQVLEAVDRRLPTISGGPLVMFLGEFHDSPEQKALQIAIIKALQKQYKVSVGMEVEHNAAFHVFSSFSEHLDYQHPSQACVSSAQFSSLAKDPRLAIEAMIASLTKTPSLAALLLSLYNADVPLFGNDAACLDDEMLDFEDPDMQRITNPGRDISARSAEGAYYRNLFMLDRISKQIEDTRPEIYIQLCGVIHVTGHTDYKGVTYPYPQSFHALSLERGMHALSIPMFSKILRPSDMPADHRLTAENSVLSIYPKTTPFSYRKFSKVDSEDKIDWNAYDQQQEEEAEVFYNALASLGIDDFHSAIEVHDAFSTKCIAWAKQLGLKDEGAHPIQGL